MIRVTTAGARFALFCRDYIVQTKGKWAGLPLLLESWQLSPLSEMLRTKPTAYIEVHDVDDPWDELEAGLAAAKHLKGRRVYREAYWQTAKKTGKSTLAYAAGLYFLIGDGEPGAEVYAAATSMEQARIVFDQARIAVQRSPALSMHVQVFKDVLYVRDTDSVFRVLSADAKTAEGLNPHANIIDEFHRHGSRDLYDTMTSQTGAREQPFTLVITNAGVDVDSVCFELYEQGLAASKRRRGSRRDLFFYAPSVPVERSTDRKAWKLASPASWITPEFLDREFRRFPLEVFRRRYLNQWVAAESPFLPEGAWDSLRRRGLELQPGAPVFAAVDLGLKHDTAAVGWASPADLDDPDTTLHVGAHVWGLHRDPEKPQPPAHVVLTDTRLPISLVEAYVEELARELELLELAYDPWKFERSAQTFDDAGLTDVVEFPQYDSYMVPATEQFYEDALNGRIVHDGDPVLAQHVANAVASETGRGVRLAKRKARNPMDAAAAVAIACYRARVWLREGAGARPSITVL